MFRIFDYIYDAVKSTILPEMLVTVVDISATVARNEYMSYNALLHWSARTLTSVCVNYIFHFVFSFTNQIQCS